MGVEAYLVSSALDCVVAQRLARRLCGKCKEIYQPEASELARFGFTLDDFPELHRAAGCVNCSKTGYRGRVAINEVMLVSEEIQRMAVERRPSDEVKAMAVEQGMKTLREDGLEKVRLGSTTLEEVLRVVA